MEIRAIQPSEIEDARRLTTRSTGPAAPAPLAISERPYATAPKPNLRAVASEADQRYIAGVMPYAVKFYAYIFAANVLAVVIVARCIQPFGFVVSMAFGLVFAYLTIVTGRWLFGRCGRFYGSNRELWFELGLRYFAGVAAAARW
jgi:hypothetical protein